MKLQIKVGVSTLGLQVWDWNEMRLPKKITRGVKGAV